MDKGVAAEFAPPAELLAKEKGMFAQLWAQHVADGGAVLTQKSMRLKPGECFFNSEYLAQVEEELEGGGDASKGKEKEKESE